MNVSHSKDWPKLLSNVTKSINHNLNPGIGLLKPYLVDGYDGDIIIKGNKYSRVPSKHNPWMIWQK